MIKVLGMCCVATAALISQALAHGGVGVEQNRCIMRIGPYIMNFSGYQPETKSFKPFCDDIPDAGRTVIVLDVEQMSSGSGLNTVNYNDLRDMAIDFRVLRNVGQANDDEDIEKNTEVYMSPKKYPGGTLHFEHDFVQPGSFIGLVSATNDHGQVYVSRFPFSVGQDGSNSIIKFGAGGVFLIGAVAGYLIYSRRKASS
jgi:hypothetical protein